MYNFLTEIDYYNQDYLRRLGFRSKLEAPKIDSILSGDVTCVIRGWALFVDQPENMSFWSRVDGGDLIQAQPRPRPDVAKHFRVEGRISHELFGYDIECVVDRPKSVTLYIELSGNLIKILKLSVRPCFPKNMYIDLFTRLLNCDSERAINIIEELCSEYDEEFSSLAVPMKDDMGVRSKLSKNDVLEHLVSKCSDYTSDIFSVYFLLRSFGEDGLSSKIFKDHLSSEYDVFCVPNIPKLSYSDLLPTHVFENIHGQNFDREIYTRQFGHEGKNNKGILLHETVNGQGEKLLLVEKITTYPEALLYSCATSFFKEQKVVPSCHGISVFGQYYKVFISYHKEASVIPEKSKILECIGSLVDTLSILAFSSANEIKIPYCYGEDKLPEIDELAVGLLESVPGANESIKTILTNIDVLNMKYKQLPIVLAHNDASWTNSIVTETNEVMLFDWDSFGLNAIGADLQGFMPLTKKEVIENRFFNELLEAYCVSVSTVLDVTKKEVLFSASYFKLIRLLRIAMKNGSVSDDKSIKRINEIASVVVDSAFY